MLGTTGTAGDQATYKKTALISEGKEKPKDYKEKERKRENSTILFFLIII